ncbi:MAG: FixH family protein [SAR324 cluster bacterium]|nr:FixH family protein [SAR324 cluster bacterium]
MRYLHIAMCLAVFLISLSSDTLAEETIRFEKNGYVLTRVELSPNPPEVGDQEIVVDLTNAEGKPVTDAEVEIEAFMPEMGTMPRMSSKSLATYLGNGRYQVELEIAMGGSWELPVRVKRPGEATVTEFPFSITMDLEGYVYKGKTGGSAKSTTANNAAPTVYLSEPRQQLIGVEIGTVERKVIAREIRTVARLDVDESRVYETVLKYNGYIEKLYADREGDFIKKGDPLFEIYSPEIYNAESFGQRQRSEQTAFLPCQSEHREKTDGDDQQGEK